MTNPSVLRIELLSAATFGSGGGLAGLVDREVEHDPDGFPYIRGRTLKGLLAEAAENVVYALELQGQDAWGGWKDHLFGRPGRGLDEQGCLHVGDACLPARLRQAVLWERRWQPGAFTPEQVLYSLTGLRRQTAINPQGGPVHSTLRTMRVVLPGVVFEAPLSFDLDGDLAPQALGLLAAAVLDLRHAGSGRNRGRGWLRAELDGPDATRAWFTHFAQQVRP